MHKSPVAFSPGPDWVSRAPRRSCADTSCKVLTGQSGSELWAVPLAAPPAAESAWGVV